MFIRYLYKSGIFQLYSRSPLFAYIESSLYKYNWILLCISQYFVLYQAVDNEEGINGELRYSVSNNNNFHMDALDGTVTTTNDFSADATDPDAVPMVNSIEVRDQALRYEDQLFDTATLYVRFYFSVF